MASATGVPAQPPAAAGAAQPQEQEPLLGRPGDVVQKQDDLLLKNLVIGKVIPRAPRLRICKLEGEPGGLKQLHGVRYRPKKAPAARIVSALAPNPMLTMRGLPCN